MTSYDFPVDNRAEAEPLYRRPYCRHSDSACRSARLKFLDSGISGRQKIRVRNSLDLIDARLAQSQLSDHFSRELFRGSQFTEAQRRPALYHCFVKQSLRHRHREERTHLAASTGLSEDQNVTGISTEIGDVVSYPF